MLQYTIEARELTSQYTPRPSRDAQPGHVTVEAADEGEAISRYVRDKDAELVSFSRPVHGGESIATVKKEDTVFLVRVYAA